MKINLIFMLIMFIMNIFFLNFNNPLIMGILIFIQLLMMIMILGEINYSFWFSYIIFLVFIGGLLILFFYMISLTYNNKFFSLNYKYMYMMIFICMFLLLINKNYMFYKSEESLNFLNFKNKNMMNSLKFFNFPNNFINLFLIFYLFILLIIVVKISKFNSGPIKLN